MGTIGRSLRGLTYVALTYVVLVWFVYLYPFHGHLDPDKRLLVAHGGCGLAGSIMSSVRSDPRVAATFLPVVMARRLVRGAENAVSAESCRMIAEELRARAPWLEWVPRRFLCQDVRRYVRRAYRAAGLRLGQDILVHDGEAMGNWLYYTELTRLGFRWIEADGGMRLVPIDADR